jgi:hypothetical protein
MKDKLLASAKTLQQPSAEALQAFSEKREQLAARGNEIMAARPDLEKLVGPGNQQMAEDNNRNFSKFMESMFTNYEPRVLMETVLWVFRAYRAHGFQTTYWAANLDIWSQLLQESLSPAVHAEISPFYTWLIVNIPLFTAATEMEAG